MDKSLEENLLLMMSNDSSDHYEAYDNVLAHINQQDQRIQELEKAITEHKEYLMGPHPEELIDPHKKLWSVLDKTEGEE